MAVAGWLDPVPQGGNSALASQISSYFVEVHDIHVGTTLLTVEVRG